MYSIHLFLASSEELKSDRQELQIFINRKNKEWHNRQLFIQLTVWEDFLDALPASRFQDAYDATLKHGDVLVMLFHTTLSRFMEKECCDAIGHFNNTNKPFVFMYFKEGGGEAIPDAIKNFQQQLNKQEHFYTTYADPEHLCLHLNNQLEKLYKAGFNHLEIRQDHLVHSAEKLHN